MTADEQAREALDKLRIEKIASIIRTVHPSHTPETIAESIVRFELGTVWLADARAELEQEREDAEMWQRQSGAADDMVEQLTSHLADAKEALWKYGRHPSDCRWWHDPKNECDCGLLDTLARLESAGESEVRG